LTRQVWPYLIMMSVWWAPYHLATAQLPSAPIGRFQLISVASGQQSGVFLLDTATGCTWQLGANPDTKRLTFIEVDVENLHWSWGSGAQQKLAQKIDESRLPEDQKGQLKQELQKTACGWTPIIPFPSSAGSTATPEGMPAKKGQ
jgi:hypothetical protein